MFQYLQSLDSVLTPWAEEEDEQPVAGEHTLARHDQIFIEVLMTLAFGRDVVVPQPYAFDSWGFLRVASRVLAARDEAGAKSEHPFRVHLHQARTFDEAVGDMLSRVGDPARPFFSLLMPELNRAADEGGSVPRSLGELLESGLIDGERAEALRTIQAELMGLPRVPAGSGPDLPGLPGLLANFAAEHSPAARVASSSEPSVQDVHAELVTAIKRLDPSRPAPFVQRSRLRRRQPWPNDGQHRLPEEIAGGTEKLRLVIDFVDTLYNCVVANSIGIAPAVYTTDIAGRSERLTRRAVALKLALADCAASVPGLGRAVRQPEGDPTFEERSDSWTVPSEGQVRAAIKTLTTRIETDALGALIEQRAARGQGGGTRSSFWTGLDKLASAIADGDARQARRSLDSHLNLVGQLLGRDAQIGLAGDKVQLVLAAAGAGAVADVIARWHIAQPEVVGILTAAGTAVTGTGIMVARSRRKVKGYRTSLKFHSYAAAASQAASTARICSLVG